MLIGYARVSTQQQNLDRQIAALNVAGCVRIFGEKASGKSIHNRPELERAITALPTAGTLVIAEWDRATRSMLDGIAIMTRVYQMGALVKVLDRPYLDLTTPIGKGILALLLRFGGRRAPPHREPCCRRPAHRQGQGQITRPTPHS